MSSHYEVPDVFAAKRKDAIDKARSEINRELRKHAWRAKEFAIDQVKRILQEDPNKDPEQIADEALDFAYRTFHIKEPRTVTHALPAAEDTEQDD